MAATMGSTSFGGLFAIATDVFGPRCWRSKSARDRRWLSPHGAALSPVAPRPFRKTLQGSIAWCVSVGRKARRARHRRHAHPAGSLRRRHTASFGADAGAPFSAFSCAGMVVVLASGRMFPGTAANCAPLGIGRARHLPAGLLSPHCSTAPRCTSSRSSGSPPWQSSSTPANSIIRTNGSTRSGTLSRVASRLPRSTARVSGIEPEYFDRPEDAGVLPTGVGVISSPEEAPAIHRHLAGLHGEALHLLDFPTVTVAVDAQRKQRALVVA